MLHARCEVCHDPLNLFFVKTDDGSRGFLCGDCIRIQSLLFNTKFVELIKHE